MVEFEGVIAIWIVSICFGLIVSFQIAHIHYVRRLIRLATRSVGTGTLAPIFAELEELTGSLQVETN